jgi:D-3-phosphoglycerate dehydrogenase / 2-oxoglutarate reductase
VRIFLASPIDHAAVVVLGERHDVTRPAAAVAAGVDPGLATCEVLVVRSGVTLSADVLSGAPNLRLVIRAGSGLDNLDLDHLASAGIRLLRVPGPGARAVAELTFGLILAVARRIAEADRQVREGRWRKHELAGPLLEDKVLGIVGAGNIGSTVGRLGIAWGMRAVGCIGRGSEVSRARLEGSGIEILDLDAVVSAADILTIHVPLLPTTRHLIGANVIAGLRPGSIVVNAARGGVVDEGALYEALASGHLAGAGLDVHEREGDGVVPRLADLPNVVLTPHIGAMASDAQRQIGARVVELVDAYERGGLDIVARAEELVL